MNVLPLFVYVIVFIVGCIPLACCVLMQEYIDWKIERERKQKRLKHRLGKMKNNEQCNRNTNE